MLVFLVSISTAKFGIIFELTKFPDFFNKTLTFEYNYIHFHICVQRRIYFRVLPLPFNFYAKLHIMFETTKYF